jgi:hypothetical protein
VSTVALKPEHGERLDGVEGLSQTLFGGKTAAFAFQVFIGLCCWQFNLIAINGACIESLLLHGVSI